MATNSFIFTAWRKAMALVICLGLISSSSPTVTDRGSLEPFVRHTAWRTSTIQQVLGSEALAARSLEQDRSPYAPALTYRLHILSERELRNWLLGIAVRKQEPGSETKMKTRVENYIEEFLKSTAEGSILYLYYRLKNAWNIPRSFQERPEGPSFHDYHMALTLLNAEAKRKLISLPHDRREFLDHIWNVYIWKLNTEILRVTGEEADEISLELRDSRGFTLRASVAQWNPAIADWAKGFALNLDRKIPATSLTGKQEILFFTRGDRSKDPPSEEGGGRKREWLGRWLPQPLSSLLGFGFAMGIVLTMFAHHYGHHAESSLAGFAHAIIVFSAKLPRLSDRVMLAAGRHWRGLRPKQVALQGATHAYIQHLRISA